MTDTLTYMKRDKDHFELTTVGYGFAVGVWENRRRKNEKKDCESVGRGSPEHCQTV